MRSLLVLFGLCATFLGTITESRAAAFGSSIMNASNVRLQYFNGTTWVDASNTQATLFGSVVTSQSTATLGALSQSSGLVTGLNAPQSFVSPSIAAPPEQGSLPLTGLGPSGVNSFARGDTFGTGTTIIGGSLSTATLAELNAVGADAGLANGNVGGTSIFQVNVAQGGQYRLAFDGSLAMQATGDGFADNSFRVQVNQSQSGGAVSIDYADPSLNRSLNGSGTVNVSTSFFSPSVVLQAGPIATFTITQNSTAGATVIPEPSSIAIFGLMSLGSLAAWRRRRSAEGNKALV